jgi:hypothetical protein
VFAVYGLIVTGGVIGPTPAGAAAATVKPDAFYGTWFDGLSPTPDTARAEYVRRDHRPTAVDFKATERNPEHGRWR